MRRELAGLITCPHCGGPLVLRAEPPGDEAVSGTLVCSCGRAYPIRNTIPRFITAPAGRTARSFGMEWRTFLIARDQEDEAVFRAKTGLAPEELRGKRVLDAGCGGGRYARIAARWGAQVFAVDLSEAVESARDLCRGLPVHVLQADLRRLPFPQRFFDVIFSIGVLHHTPDTREHMRALTRHLALGGTFSLWLYKRWRPALEAVNSAQRAFTKRLPLPVMLRLAEILEPVGRAKVALSQSRSPLVRRLGVLANVLTIGVSMHPVRAQRVCDTFDWYSPEYQSHHTDEEVRLWLVEEGFGDIRNLSERSGYSFHPGQGEGVNLKATLSARPASSGAR
ncbi:MAG: methyltransferase domain-containing protein [Planctomycetota bacterium]